MVCDLASRKQSGAVSEERRRQEAMKQERDRDRARRKSSQREETTYALEICRKEMGSSLYTPTCLESSKPFDVLKIVNTAVCSAGKNLQPHRPDPTGETLPRCLADLKPETCNRSAPTLRLRFQQNSSCIAIMRLIDDHLSPATTMRISFCFHFPKGPSPCIQHTAASSPGNVESMGIVDEDSS